MQKLICCICLLALGTIPIGCVTSKDLYPLDERLFRLERQLQALDESTQKTIGAKESRLRDQTASLAAQLDILREKNQQLSGRIEELEFQLNGNDSFQKETLVQRIEVLTQRNQALTARIAQLERYLNLELTAVSDGNTTSPGLGSSASSASEQGLFELAKSAFDRDDVETARVNFETFVRQYPKSRQADDAQFFLAEIFYREKWYEKAILEYQKVIEAYPDGNRVSAALLKQAIAFNNLKDPTNARLIYKELIRRYPNSNEAEIARQKLADM